MNLKCLVLRHKWQPAEEANDSGLRLACQRCGKVRTYGAMGPGSSREFITRGDAGPGA